MISNDAARFYRIAAGLASSLGDQLRNRTDKLSILDAGLLKVQLSDPSKKYPDIVLGLNDFEDALQMLSGGDSAAGDVLKLANDFFKILANPNPADIVNGLNAVGKDVQALFTSLPIFVGHQIAIALSVVAIFGDLVDPELQAAPEERLKRRVWRLFLRRWIQAAGRDRLSRVQTRRNLVDRRRHPGLRKVQNGRAIRSGSGFYNSRGRR